VHALGFDPWPGLSRLHRFKALPHRLEKLGDVGDVEIVDDSIATAPHATVAALEALDGPALAVIVGGQDRGMDWSVLAQRLRTTPVTVVLAMGQCAPRIATAIDRGAPDQPVVVVDSLDDAVRIAFEHLPEQGILLLSPGAPSYDAFTDYTQRGTRFADLAFRQSRSGGSPQ